MSTSTSAARWGGGSARSAVSTSSRVSTASARLAWPPPDGVGSRLGHGQLVRVARPADGAPRRLPAKQVKRGVDHDPVQPGGDGGIAAEVLGPAEGRDHRLLERVGGVIRVAHDAERDRPQPVLVAQEQRAEGLLVPGQVPPEQFGVGRASDRRRAALAGPERPVPDAPVPPSEATAARSRPAASLPRRPRSRVSRRRRRDPGRSAAPWPGKPPRRAGSPSSAGWSARSAHTGRWRWRRRSSR